MTKQLNELEIPYPRQKDPKIDEFLRVFRLRLGWPSVTVLGWRVHDILGFLARSWARYRLGDWLS